MFRVANCTKCIYSSILSQKQKFREQLDIAILGTGYIFDADVALEQLW